MLHTIAYDLRVIAVGFASQTHGVQLQAGGTASADFALSRAVISLDEVVVTATGEQRARESGNAITNITSVSLPLGPPSSIQIRLISAYANWIPGWDRSHPQANSGAGSRSTINRS